MTLLCLQDCEIARLCVCMLCVPIHLCVEGVLFFARIYQPDKTLRFYCDCFVTAHKSQQRNAKMPNKKKNICFYMLLTKSARNDRTCHRIANSETTITKRQMRERLGQPFGTEIHFETHFLRSLGSYQQTI